MGSIAWGKVVARHPSEGTADVAFAEGGTIQHVPVLCSPLSTEAGAIYQPAIDLAAPIADPDGVWDVPGPSGGADQWVAIAFVGGSVRQPLIIGSIPSRVGQMLTTTPGIALERHESGVYRVTTPAGHDELHWPDGTFLTVGQDTTSYDMTAENAAWNPPTLPALNVVLKHSSGASLTITPVGAVQVQAAAGQLVTLGEAGSAKPVARQGDPVSVNTTTGVGTITSGSTEVQSG